MGEATHFEREIHEQPAALARQLAEGRAAAEEAAARMRRADPKVVLIAARGTSDNAARYAQYLLGAHNRLVVALAAPSLFTLYDAPPRVDGALVVGVSQSGQSPDIVAVLTEARRQGAPTLAITNVTTSPLAQAADHVVPLFVGEERAVAATKTYTGQLMALAMISAALEGSATRWEELAALPDQVAATLQAPRDALVSLAARCRYAERFLVLGRGFNYATAFEIALKIKETSYVIAEPYSTADFLHGPAALLERGFPVLVFSPRGRAQADTLELLALLEKRDCEVLMVSDDDALLPRAGSSFRVPAGLPEWLSPIAHVVPGQLFALALARVRRLDPDQPRGLRKVTHTR